MSKARKNPADGDATFADMANPKATDQVDTVSTRSLDEQLEQAILGPQGYLSPDAINDPDAVATVPPADPVVFDQGDVVIPMPTPDLGMTAPMSNGWEAPRTKYKKDADPLLVRALELFERIVAGGILNPYASSAHAAVIDLTGDIRKKVAAA